MTDLTPKSGKAEFHLTYACDLECAACNRGSFLKKPHTDNMTLDDAREFMRQADALGWRPDLVTLVGGEPTLHPDFEGFVDLLVSWPTKIQVWSNAYRPRATELVQLAMKRKGVTVCRDTEKPGGSIAAGEITFDKDNLGKRPDGSWWSLDMYISPDDFGLPLREPCFQHSSIICGIAVDHGGYAPCALGGNIDALLTPILGPGGRTKQLADLWNPETMARMTAHLCRHCGQQKMERIEGMLERCDTSRFGTPMSPTWIKAFEARK